MLTIDQKEAILRRAGITVPAFPDQAVTGSGHEDCLRRWTEAIDLLYLQYAAARAAKSLRDAEQAQEIDALRRAAERSGA